VVKDKLNNEDNYLMKLLKHKSIMCMLIKCLLFSSLSIIICNILLNALINKIRKTKILNLYNNN